MLNKSDNEIYIMAPGEGNVLDYIVLNKAFNLEDLLSLWLILGEKF